MLFTGSSSKVAVTLIGLTGMELALTDGHLGYVGHQVVGNRFGVQFWHGVWGLI
jgi:hypothetical protein